MKTKRGTYVLIGLYAAAIVGLLAGYAYKHTDDSMRACVMECVAKCGR